MKLKSWLGLLGIGTRPKNYGYELRDMDVGEGLVLRYAHWLHPGERPKTIDAALVDAYREVLSPGDFAIDIGAHTGDTTLPMAVAVGAEGCVLALEPNPFVYRVLEKNARANAAALNIQTIMAAASDAPGFMEFEYSDSGFCNGGRHEGISVLKHGHPFKLTVSCIDLVAELREDFSGWLPKLRFIKVDAEGYDLYILRAIEALVIDQRPVIKAEVFKRTDLDYRRALLAFLEQHGYAVFRVAEEPLTRGERITEANLEQWRHYDVVCFPPDAAAG